MSKGIEQPQKIIIEVKLNDNYSELTESGRVGEELKTLTWKCGCSVNNSREEKLCPMHKVLPPRNDMIEHEVSDKLEIPRSRMVEKGQFLRVGSNQLEIIKGRIQTRILGDKVPNDQVINVALYLGIDLL